MVDNYKNWPHNLPFSSWGNWASIQSSTEATPYSLVYEIEAVLPIEIAITIGNSGELDFKTRNGLQLDMRSQ